MRKLATLLIALGLLAACAASVQEQRATLERAAGMLGAADVKTLEYTGSGVHYQSGQSQTPGDRWPRFTLPSFTRVMSYETASMQTPSCARRARIRRAAAACSRSAANSARSCS